MLAKKVENLTGSFIENKVIQRNTNIQEYFADISKDVCFMFRKVEKWVGRGE